ncbi:MAG: malto-oligosyltrehalose trehalohydrolase [Acidobacteriales bacterium]|nr:malto-oligosyltrehalose trehalohydrolase [Terriglobales bacterium]
MMPIGAEPRGDGTHFRVWAPKRKRVEVVSIDSEKPLWELPVQQGTALVEEGNGYYSGLVPSIAAGQRYAFALDGDGMFPDPASRFQPFGPHGASQIVDPNAFSWAPEESRWKGCSLKGQVIYEMHLGTFTREGTYRAAIDKLQHLRDTGITVLELMPVADFPGKFGWGYDGVNLFAPSRLYGGANELRELVQAAHKLGLGVILDVVYNHLGPSGNYLGQFSDWYLTEQKHKTDWGAAINYDGDNSGPVREYFVQNAAYWIREFHFDGLRLDATQAILDDSEIHVVRELRDEVVAASGGKQVFIVAENEDQDARLMHEYGIDGVWNDDFHHSAIVAATGNRQAYYLDYLGKPQEFISAAKYGYLYQGQQYRWQRKRRGRSVLGCDPHRFVTYIENHDQVANSAWGERLSTLVSPARLRALTALMLLSPGTPMLFQGQEWGASSPFVFFADHEPELAKLVRSGRHKFLSQFPALAVKEVQSQLDDPESDTTFKRCKLDWNELDMERGQRWLHFHRDLLALRREDPAFSSQGVRVDGAVLGENAFLLRYFVPDDRDRLLVVNLGPDLLLYSAPEPLLAPLQACAWQMHWHSERPQYGGSGMAAPDTDTEQNWMLRAESAVLLTPVKTSEDQYNKRLWRICPEMNENDEAARKQMEGEEKK